MIDKNVWIAAILSKRGASYKLLSMIDSEKFEVNISVPLILEYEDIAKRLVGEISLTTRDIDDILDYICQTANQNKIYYLWRPFLNDPNDDMVLELAVTANCDFIITFNQSDFRGADQFGVEIVTPQDFLRKIGVLS